MAIIAMLTGMNTWYREKGRLSLNEIENIYTAWCCAWLVGQTKEDVMFTAE
jgi:hypothetical protein